ncbi:MAG: class I SAM-dependent methyltransferase [Stellaceae bacterium]
MRLFRRDGPRPLPLSERLYRRFFLKYHARSLVAGLQMRAREQSLDYIEAYMRDALIFRDRWELLLHAARAAPPQGLMLEFGVADGASLRYVASRVARSFHGFDSFEGLPEDWAGTFERKGKFGRAGALPAMPTNARLYPGWFADTLPRFLGEHGGETVAFVHVDCDIYASTATVLRHLGDRFGPGAILVFDEYFNYPNWQRHEWRAFQEFVRDTGMAYTYLGYAQKNGHVAVRLGEKSTEASRLAAEKLTRLVG